MGGQTITLIKTAADIHIDKSVWFTFPNITSPSGFPPPSHYNLLPTTLPLPIKRTPLICNYYKLYGEIVTAGEFYMSFSSLRAVGTPAACGWTTTKDNGSKALWLVQWSDCPRHFICFGHVTLKTITWKPLYRDWITTVNLQHNLNYGLGVAKGGTNKWLNSETGGGRDEVWDRETMFSQLTKRSPRVVVSG